jgi:hypothetical protein
MIRYHVERNQKGWVKALPKIRFQMMNTVNASMGYSGFELKMGRCPRVIPPIVPTKLSEVPEFREIAKAAIDAIKAIDTSVEEAKDKVMLSTKNRQNEYKRKGEKCVAKFFPHWDGLYTVIKAWPDTSNYKLDLPASNAGHNIFHLSELKRYLDNDTSLFPAREPTRPGPIVSADGLEEYLIDKIVDSRKRGCGTQYLVHWQGYSRDADTWLPARELEECKALECWLSDNGSGLDAW